jgi:hypothetical protein
MHIIGCARLSRPCTCAAAPAPADRETVTLLYDVRDLIVPRAHDVAIAYDEFNWPRFDDTAGEATPPPRRDQLVSTLKQLLMETIDPISWRDRANGPGIIDEEAGMLIVTQLPDNHAKVERLLKQLRETRSLQVTVTSFVLTDGDLLDSIERIGGKWLDAGPDAQMVYLSAEQLTQLLADRRAKLLTAPRMTLFNGQRAFVIVGNETAYVADYATAADGRAGAGGKPEAVTRTVNSGVVIDCIGTISSDRQYITLTLHPRVSTLRDMKQLPWPDAPAPAERQLLVQVPHVETAALDLTVSVPNDGCILLRTTPKAHPPPDANAPPPHPVHLAFSATVIESEPVKD